VSDFPPASGVRAQWDDLPTALRAQIEAALGTSVVAAVSQSGGFSPGVAARVRGADGSRAFIKAVSEDANPFAPSLHRAEIDVARRLPAEVPAPALRWWHNDGNWVVLLFDEIEGVGPELPWRSAELARVLDAVHALSRQLTPAPFAAEPATTKLEPLMNGWHDIAADDEARDALTGVWRERLDELVELESGWREAVAGDTLLHLDVRADNVVLTDDRVYFVDWPWAGVGAAWLDLALMLGSVAMQGGPDPETVWASHPLAAAADPAHVDVIVGALAGTFTRECRKPAPRGLPTLRAFQAGHAEQFQRWFAKRRF
jgi:aminoglycoside phosphotransferase